MEKKITIQETLESQDVAWGDFLIYSEMIEGARRPLVFIETITEDFSLIGKNGTQIYVPTATQLGATKISSTIETTLQSAMSTADKTISKVTVAVSVFIYCGVEMSDILSEDYPNIDWVRLNLRNMGLAVMEQIDTDILAIYAAGFGVLSTCSTLNHSAVMSALASMANGKWFPDPNSPPFLIVSPDALVTLKTDTQFFETARYYSGMETALVGEAGLYAGCRVLVTPSLNGTGNAYIVFPPNSSYGPVAILAWKRRLTVKSDRTENKETTYYYTTARVTPVVTQALGICRINITSTP